MFKKKKKKKKKSRGHPLKPLVVPSVDLTHVIEFLPVKIYFDFNF